MFECRTSGDREVFPIDTFLTQIFPTPELKRGILGACSHGQVMENILTGNQVTFG